MATFNLKRFSRPAALKAIRPERLMRVLAPHRAFFETRHVSLPSHGSADGLDYDGLVRVLMTPDSDTPADLASALYFIHEMATPHGMDELLCVSERRGIQFAGDPQPTAADVAVQVWLEDPELLKRKHAEQYLARPRSFEYYQTATSSVPELADPSEETLGALAKDLDDWFMKRKRGRGAQVQAFSKPDVVWFLVRHGKPYERRGVIEDGASSSVFLQPEAHDVLAYDRTVGELRMHACSKSERDVYRRKFGRHLFGSEDFFPGTAKYTLEPLRRDGARSLVCSDVEGMDWVRLKQLDLLWGGAERHVEVQKASDVFAALAARDRGLPDGARPIQAHFSVKFTDSKTPRTVVVKPSNVTQYMRDDDATIAETWLRKRGFIVSER
jgi:hypothetical protein